jgi:hypothetical protein
MSGMHHALMIVAKFLSGTVGFFAFYFAFFVYEDDAGKWQNRLEGRFISSRAIFR